MTDTPEVSNHLVARPRNPEMGGIIAGAVILAAAILCFFVPWLFDMDMMRSGYALQCLAGFGAIVGAVILLFWIPRAATMQKILTGQGVLVRWQYPLTTRDQQARKEMADRLETNKGIYIVMLLFAVLFGVIFFVIPAINGDMSPLVVVAWFGFFAVLGLFAWGMPRLEYRRALHSNTDVAIAHDGIYIYGALQTWKQPFTSLKKVVYQADAKPPALAFTIRYLTRTGFIHYDTYKVSVPVPLGQEDKALEIVEYFRS